MKKTKDKIVDAILFIIAWAAILLTFWLFLGLDLRVAGV